MKLITVFLIIFFLTGKVTAQYLAEPKYPELLESKSVLIQSGQNYTVEQLEVDKYIFKTYWDAIADVAIYATYDNRDFKTLHGLYAVYNEDGSVFQKGEYYLGDKDGDWQEESMKKGRYERGKKVGDWITYDAGNNIIKKEQYENGKLHGITTDFDQDGNEINWVHYSHGNISSGAELNPDLIIKPAYAECLKVNSDESDINKCTFELILNHLNNKKYPSKARNEGVQGKLIVRFTVDENGKVKDVMPLRPSSDTLINDFVGQIRSLPKFIPASKNGVNVKQWMTIPKVYKLDGPSVGR